MKMRIAMAVLAAALIAPAAYGFGIGDLKKVDVNKAVSTGKQFAEATKDIQPSEEYYIGRAVAANILQKYPLLNDAALTGYVNRLGLTIARNTDMPYTYGGYHFAVLNTNDVNAFACPGGIVFVTKGLLTKATSEDELAGAIAHEVAHIAHRDGVSALKKAQWTKLGVDTAVEVGKHYTPEQAKALTGAFTNAVADVTKKVLNNEYGKDAEKKADGAAVGYMAKAGYDPQALVQLVKTAGESGGYLSMHDKPGKRVSWLEQDISKNNYSGEVSSKRTARFSSKTANMR